jgi:hypothetical protein
MGIYGGKYTSINENILFISNEGKQIKRKIKDICKFNRADFTLKTLGTKYDEKIANKVCESIRKLFKTCLITNTYFVVTTTSINGVIVTTTDYYRDIIGIYGNYIVKIKLYLAPRGCSLSSFNELSTERLIYPKDILEYAIKSIPQGTKYTIVYSKKAIKISYTDANIFNNNDSVTYSILNKLESYIDSKHSDLKYNRTNNSIKFN